MASLLLLLSLTATTSSVFASDYIVRFRCNGYEDNASGYRFCELNLPYVNPDEIDYHYKLELITDESYLNNDRCEENNYRLVMHNNKVTARVSSTCVGFFGVKRRNKGYPYMGGCGQDNFGGFKIVDGHKANPCQFPWMVFVRLNWERKANRANCGGSIISDQWILTAAHCIVLQGRDGLTPPVGAVTVRTGSIHKNEWNIVRRVRRIVIHYKYENRNLGYDIALLQLEKPIVWDHCHAPVCLNKDTTPEESDSLTCRISGWGRSRPTGNHWPDTLLWAYDHILSRSECDKIYKVYSNDYTICGRATANNGRGFCAADSGGPLVCKSNGKYYQHGIVSLYIGDQFCRMEGLYSSVKGFHSWIIRYIES